MQINLFAEETQLQKLTKLGDSLEKLNIIDFESFRPLLVSAARKERKNNAGRPAFDVVMMFKVLVLQRLFNLSDDQTEYQITDRMSFQRFIGLSLGEHVPDAKTIWLFRDTLTKSGVMEELFAKFNAMLIENGMITHTGTIVDATFVDAPRQRNSRDENEQVKNNETHFGYKDHVKVDADSKIITDYTATAANVHDSNHFTEFLTEEDEVVYADSAYVGKEIPNHVENCVCEKGYRNHPLTDEQKANNRKKSKIRCRIEHVFGYMTGSMHGITLRSIGMKRAEFNIGLTNLVYNICRYTILKRKEVCMG